MCGIALLKTINNSAEHYRSELEAAVLALNNRGPDQKATLIHENVGLGHARLSILDLSEAGKQPMQDQSGRYAIIFNGEVYNFQEIAKDLKSKGVKFKSGTDTEVLLYAYIHYGPTCVEIFNGFFAFAIYDKQEQSLFIARDRFGIKPLLMYKDKLKIAFASELKALMQLPIKKELNQASLKAYLQLNYIPAPLSILKNVQKVKPGSYLLISKTGEISTKQYYQLPKTSGEKYTYEQAKQKLVELMESSVQKRMIADVPLGAFLSGGIDSSVIVALASKYTKDLNTFSIGYKDEPFFDETQYANLVAKKFKTNHTVFSLSNDDLYEHLDSILDYIDEPFADSSSIAVNILSKMTRKHVTVSLSGDGADEIFSGYNKHLADYRARKGGLINTLVKIGAPIWKAMPKSRNDKFSNLIRQLDRFALGLKKTDAERYWRWCAFIDETDAEQLLENFSKDDQKVFEEVKQSYLADFNQENNINDSLRTDVKLVLQNDMLVKVDTMSMANSLEVRVPFLDHNIVDFAFSLPEEYKIGGGFRKRILKDAFRDVLPEELYNRPKHGFEVPILKWFQTSLKDRVQNEWLEKDFIQEQGIFNLQAIELLKKKLFSPDPGEVHAQIWALIVFQNWWKKYMD